MMKRPHSYMALPAYKGSFGLLSSVAAESIERAVIFVHGYNGTSRGTWTDFLSLVDEPSASEWWQVSDLFFFHYRWDSIFRRLVNNTLSVYKFSRSIFPQPYEALGKDNPFRHASFSYRELVLVGHSLGGLLIRRAILEAAQAEPTVQTFLDLKEIGSPSTPPSPTGLLMARVRLFAPALGGEMLTGLFGVLASLPIISNALVISASKKDLSPGSDGVTRPREQTDRYARIFSFDCFRAHILWAENDLVISGEKYEKDKHCLSFPPGSDHVNVCKPRSTYLLPLEFVELGVKHDGCQ